MDLTFLNKDIILRSVYNLFFVYLFMDKEHRFARALDVTKRKIQREKYERYYARVEVDQRKNWLGWALALILFLLALSMYVSYS